MGNNCVPTSNRKIRELEISNNLDSLRIVNSDPDDTYETLKKRESLYSEKNKENVNINVMIFTYPSDTFNDILTSKNFDSHDSSIF